MRTACVCERRFCTHVPGARNRIPNVRQVSTTVLGLFSLFLSSFPLAEMCRCCTCRRWPLLLDLQHSLYVLVCVGVRVCVCVCKCMCVEKVWKKITIVQKASLVLVQCVFMKFPQGGFQRPLGTLRSPPALSAGPHMENQAFRSPGH